MCRAAAGSKILLLEEEILSWCVSVGEGGTVLVDLSENMLDLRDPMRHFPGSDIWKELLAQNENLDEWSGLEK